MHLRVYNYDITNKRDLPDERKKETKMKKIISLILAFSILAMCVFAMASCNKDDNNLSAAYDKIVADLEFDDSNCETLTVAMSPDFAPMEFVDLAKKGQDQYVGFDVILAKYLAKELNKKLVIKPMSFDACTAALETGAADLAISGFSWTEERAEYYLISDYYIAGENESDQVLITTSENSSKFTAEMTDFSGLKIGAQGASLQKILVEEQCTGAELELYESLNDAIVALQTGKIDALAVAKGNGEAFVSSTQDSSTPVVLSAYSFFVDELYKNNVILLNKNSTELLEAINAALAKALAAGLYDTWYEACQIYAEVKTIDELGYDDEGNKITE